VRAWRCGATGNYAYIADGFGLQVISVSDSRQPRRVGGKSAFHPSDITVAGNNVFVTAGEQGLMIFDLCRAHPAVRACVAAEASGFRVRLHGEAGLSVRVQRSANLRDWEDWQSVTLGAVPAELTDPDAGAVPQRFYRAVHP
jgi:hypothetical protein